MKHKVLFIIGNGFDLAHGMKTSYHDFRDWVNMRDTRYVATMEKCLNCCGEMLWANLEENTRLLNSIDYKEKFYKYSSHLTQGYSTSIIDQNENLIDSYTEDNSTDKWLADLMSGLFYQQGFQHYLEEELFWLYRLKWLFCEWIKSIEVTKNPPYSIPKNALYMSFNYTSLLEDTYKIAPKNILHIHGNASGEIEFGNPDLALFNYESEDTRALEAKDEINHALKNVHKDVMLIISKNHVFFSTLNEIQKVYILGHSMNEIDEPYFSKIKENVFSKAHWTISYYNESDRLRAEDLVFGKLGIDRFKIEKLDNILKNRILIKG